MGTSGQVHGSYEEHLTDETRGFRRRSAGRLRHTFVRAAVTRVDPMNYSIRIEPLAVTTWESAAVTRNVVPSRGIWKGCEKDRVLRISSPRATPVIGEPLLHPISLVAVGVLLLNDHVLKTYYPSWVTGKLSDMAGMVFFPLLLLTLVDLSTRLVQRKPGLTRQALYACILLTAVVFATVKTTYIGGDAFRWVWAVLQWPAHAVAAHRLVPLERVRLVMDATDLEALPMLLISAWIGLKSTNGA